MLPSSATSAASRLTPLSRLLEAGGEWAGRAVSCARLTRRPSTRRFSPRARERTATETTAQEGVTRIRVRRCERDVSLRPLVLRHRVTLDPMFVSGRFRGSCGVCGFVVAVLAASGPAAAQVTQTDAVATPLPQPVPRAEADLVNDSGAWNANTVINRDRRCEPVSEQQVLDVRAQRTQRERCALGHDLDLPIDGRHGRLLFRVRRSAHVCSGLEADLERQRWR